MVTNDDKIFISPIKGNIQRYIERITDQKYQGKGLSKLICN